MLEDLGTIDLAGIDWVIVGGESVGKRPCDLRWIRSVVRQCKAAGVPVFVKQLGSNPMQPAVIDDAAGTGATAVPYPFIGDLNDPKGGDPDFWPADLRVRELPTSPAAALAEASR